MAHLIAFTGPAGAGKSTAAEALMARGWARVSFAAPLRSMLRDLLAHAGVEPEEIERMVAGSLKEKPHPALMGQTPRHALQTLGTEWGRRLIHPDLWTETAARRIVATLRGGVSVVVDDCRFPNEVELVRGLGGKVVGISGRGGIPGSHASEAGVQADFSMENTGGVEAFRREVVWVCDERGW